MNISDTIHALTIGRPYVLVIMPYKDKRSGLDKNKALFETIQSVARSEFNVACLRADEVLVAGQDLLAKIHLLIDQAELVIAECSDTTRANVFYELGYAMGAKKQPLLLIQRGIKLPYNLRGLEFFEYEDSLDGLKPFSAELARHLRFRLRSEVPTLRAMLGATEPEASFIVASPKYPGEHSRIKGQVYDRRTFGDHLGILGLISAFGAMYGEANKGIELISAQHAPPDLLSQNCNWYLIGSRKVNTFSGVMMNQLQGNCYPKWVFAPPPKWDKGEEEDWKVAMYRIDTEGRRQIKGIIEEIGDVNEQIWTTDYGLIIRGPSPDYPNRLALIMAGAHSLGTGAACLAATRSSLIRKLRDKLPIGTLEDKGRTFWALVKGTVNRNDFLLDEDGVTIEDAGVYVDQAISPNHQ